MNAPSLTTVTPASRRTTTPLRLNGASIILVVMVLAPPAAQGWSYKEHIQFTRIAANRLIADPTTPPEMKAWLRAALPDDQFDLGAEERFFMTARIGIEPKVYQSGLLRYAYEPDVHALKDRATSKVAPYGAHERLMHYIDLELFVTGPTSRAYRPDLSAKPRIEDVPRDPTDPRFIQAGFLPMRVEEMYDSLVRTIRAGKLAPADDKDRDHALRYAGYLAHYVADNTQPQHSTVDYKSQSYFKNARRAPNVHAAVEYLMCDDEKNDYPELRREYWPLFVQELESFEDPVRTEDLFRATLEVAMQSYDALPLIGEAAVAATVPAAKGARVDTIDAERFFRHKGKLRGEEVTVAKMKARQTAWAVKRIERILLRAWIEAKGPADRQPAAADVSPPATTPVGR